MRTVSTLLFLICLGGPIVNSQITSPAKTQSKSESLKTIPTVDLCELGKHPDRYFNQTIQVEAKWEIGNEFSYLNDDRCPMGDLIAVGFVDVASQREDFRQSSAKIMSPEYGGRAMIQAVGVLRNPGKFYGYFHYRFEILRLEEFTHVIVPYEGELDAGKTYRARVRGDKNFGWAPIPSIRLPFHYSMFIEWINLSEYPSLAALRNDASHEPVIVFSVLSDERKQMTATRWDRRIECKIILVE